MAWLPWSHKAWKPLASELSISWKLGLYCDKIVPLNILLLMNWHFSTQTCFAGNYHISYSTYTCAYLCVYYYVELGPTYAMNKRNEKKWKARQKLVSALELSCFPNHFLIRTGQYKTQECGLVRESCVFRGWIAWLNSALPSQMFMLFLCYFLTLLYSLTYGSPLNLSWNSYVI